MLFRSSTIPPWSRLAGVGRYPVVKLTVLAPVFGYMVLFNELISRYLSLSMSYFSTSVDLKHEWRMQFFYFGLVLLGIGQTIFTLRCPSEIKKHPTVDEFIKSNFEHITRYGVKLFLNQELIYHKERLENFALFKELTELMEKGNYGALPFSSENKIDITAHLYYYSDQSDINGRAAALIFYSAGFFILIIPSVHIFILILANLPH